MEQAPSSGIRSGNSGTTYSLVDMVDTILFEEEIRSMVAKPAASGTSFIAFFSLPPSQAIELLHDSDPPSITTTMTPSSSSSAAAAIAPAGSFLLPLGCSPTFPTNVVLVDRAERFSVFVVEKDSLEATDVSWKCLNRM